MPIEDGVAAEKAAEVPASTETVIGGADGPTVSFTVTEADAMEQAVNEAMNSEPQTAEQVNE